MFFSRKKQIAAPHLDYSLMRQSALESGDSAAILQANADFAHHCLRAAYFSPAEIPAAAVKANYLHYYLTQVRLGGHKHFAVSSRWGSDVLKNVADALIAMNMKDYAHVFLKLLRFANAEPERFQRQMLMDPAELERETRAHKIGIGALDEEFFALGAAHAESVAANWLKANSVFHIVADDEWRSALEALDRRNPLLAERRQAERQRYAQDPLAQGLSYLCWMAKPQPLKYIAWLASGSNLDAHNVKYATFHVQTNEGLMEAIIHPQMCQLRLKGERNPASVMSMNSLEKFVQNKTGASLMNRLQLAVSI